MTKRAAAARALGLPADRLAAMDSCGVAHDHFRIINAGLVLRVPRAQALQGLERGAALARQAAAFQRAAACAHTPRLHDVVSPGPDLPFGALVVEEIIGRPPRLPDDMPAIAAALAALHALPVPPPDRCAPLETAPLRRLLAFVEGRVDLFVQADLPPAVLGVLLTELARAAAEVTELTAAGLEGPPALAGVDVHPGNFLITADGRAVLTDLERAQYGHPAADLAHASLPTSTRWDPGVAASLTDAETQRFYAAWETAVGDKAAAQWHPAAAAARRLVWLRTLTWMAHWRLGGRAAAPAMAPELLAHMDAHAAWALSADGVAAVAAGL